MFTRALLRTALLPALHQQMFRPSGVVVASRLQDVKGFASKKKKGGGGGGKKNNTQLSLKLCNASYEIDEPAMDDYNRVKLPKMPSNLDELQKMLEKQEVIDGPENIEYYHDGEWKDLDNPSQQLKGKDIPIRIPSMYEEDDEYAYDPDEDYDPSDYDSDFGEGGGSVRIREFAEELKSEGYSRASSDQLQKDDIVIPTRDWVLEKAAKDKSVQSMLLSRVGYLDHIVQCLHYDFVWEDAADSEVEDANTEDV